MEAILIAKLIFALKVPKDIKQRITTCTFYNVPKGTADLWKRYRTCKLRHKKRPHPWGRN